MINDPMQFPGAGPIRSMDHMPGAGPARREDDGPKFELLAPISHAGTRFMGGAVVDEIIPGAKFRAINDAARAVMKAKGLSDYVPVPRPQYGKATWQDDRSAATGALSERVATALAAIDKASSNQCPHSYQDVACARQGVKALVEIGFHLESIGAALTRLAGSAGQDVAS